MIIFTILMSFVAPYLISSLGAYLWVHKQFNNQWRMISPEIDSIFITFTPIVNTGFTVVLLLDFLFFNDTMYMDRYKFIDIKRKKTKLDKFFGIKVEEY